MRIVALISGGKDSCFNMMHAVAEGHTIVALANLYPSNQDNDEIDSYMYQTVGHEAISLYSEAMDIPIYRRKITGYPKSKNLDYISHNEDEVEDLFELLRDIQSRLAFEAVSCGAILSDYQRIRVESVCSRLGLRSLSYLWQRDQEELLDEMISCDVKAIVIKTAAYGLDPYKHLGKTLDEMSGTLKILNKKYGSHVCGEGGEFETFTLDCPLFKKRMVVDQSDIIIHSDDHFATVGYLKLKKIHLELKREGTAELQSMPILTSAKWAKQYYNRSEEHSYNQNVCAPLMPLTSSQACISKAKKHKQGIRIVQGIHFTFVTNLYGVVSSPHTSDAIEEETSSVLKTLQYNLESLGHALQDIVYVQIYVRNMTDYQHINKAYCKFFDRNPPARACIGCIDKEQFDITEATFQMTAILCKQTDHRKSMHVQSISHWAPPNIGPFSQCYLINNILFVSGTIALVPGTVTLIDGGARNEAVVALGHVEKVVDVMAKSSPCHSMNCICYVTDVKDIQPSIVAWDQKGDAIAESASPVFVVVNQLPKSAHVEWQMVGYKTTENLQFKSNSCRSTLNDIGVKVHNALITDDGVRVCAFIASIEHMPTATCSKLNQYLEVLNQYLLKWVETQSLQHTNLVQSYLFTSLKSNDLITLYQSWQNVSEFPATIANVKHIYFEGKFQLVTIMCLFYDRSVSNVDVITE